MIFTIQFEFVTRRDTYASPTDGHKTINAFQMADRTGGETLTGASTDGIGLGHEPSSIVFVVVFWWLLVFRIAFNMHDADIYSLAPLFTHSLELQSNRKP